MCQLNSGMSSHIFAVGHQDDDDDGMIGRASSKNSTRTSSKRSVREAKQKGEEKEAQEKVDAVMGTGNHLAKDVAWRRLSASAHQHIHADGPPGTTLLEEEKVPIMAGIVDSGYRKGDRVKASGVRLPGAVPGGSGWDPINVQTDAGWVVGAGRNPGEIMVKFDISGHTCSMKMSQIQHLKAKEPDNNIERSHARKSLPRLTTL
jgi:hypothetical protein